MKNLIAITAFLLLAGVIFVVPVSAQSAPHRVSPASSAMVQSGIDGQSTEGPLIAKPPVILGKNFRNKQLVCNATIVLKDAQTGKEVARIWSNKNGFYKLDVPPGEYILEATPPNQKNGLPKSFFGKVIVKAGQRTEANSFFDTGVR